MDDEIWRNCCDDFVKLLIRYTTHTYNEKDVKRTEETERDRESSWLCMYIQTDCNDSGKQPLQNFGSVICCAYDRDVLYFTPDEWSISLMIDEKLFLHFMSYVALAISDTYSFDT